MPAETVPAVVEVVETPVEQPPLPPKKIPLASVNLDLMMRVEISQETVDRYADAMLHGAKFPPVVAFVDESDDRLRAEYLLADGFHRYFAVRRIARLIGPNAEQDTYRALAAEQGLGDCKEIEAEIHQGTEFDAVLYAAGANSKHGLPLKNEDKRRIVHVLLLNPKCSGWSDRRIAQECGFSGPFVAKVRSELNASANGLQTQWVRRALRGGVAYEMDTSAIGKRAAPETATPRPPKERGLPWPPTSFWHGLAGVLTRLENVGRLVADTHPTLTRLCADLAWNAKARVDREVELLMEVPETPAPSEQEPTQQPIAQEVDKAEGVN